jgi:Alpha/beta hydrolase of unknown function (DUF900)
MTLYLSLRSQEVGGEVQDPVIYEGDGLTNPLQLTALSATDVHLRIAGRDVLFVAHGFNVSRSEGARSFAQLEPYLRGTGALGPADVFLGVLWPGDFWIPVINYPFEGGVAMDCGRRLARFCGDTLAAAHSFSFVSHSLGARVILEAVQNLGGRKARMMCLTAAAIDRYCLTAEYARAVQNTENVAVLASHEDHVLKLAFPVGDIIADLLHHDHPFLQKALGYDGPPLPPPPSPVSRPWQIPDAPPYDHGDYLPPSGPGNRLPPAPNALWLKPADFMGRAFRRQAQTWPP